MFKFSHSFSLSLLIISALMFSILIPIVWLKEFDVLTIHSNGSIKTINIEAYADEDLQNKVITLNWGIIWPGAVRNITIYLKNISNIQTKLLLNSSQIYPQNISDHVELSWNYNGEYINPGQTKVVTISLSLSSENALIKYYNDSDYVPFFVNIEIIAY